MSEESIFLDESGDFGSNSKYYLVTLVFHNQDNPIDGALAKLNQELAYLDFPTDCAIHTGPIIRREDMYVNMGVPERKRIFTKLYAFTRNAGVTYKTFSYKKSEYPDRMKLKARFARELSKSEIGFFGSAGKIRRDYLKQLDKMRFER